MPLRYSYTDAADRLLEDAVVLWMKGRHESAAHLAGLSAECMLKSIFIGLGAAVPGLDGQFPRSNATKNVRAHVDKLWGELTSLLQGHSGAAYLQELPAGDPYLDWLVDHRYVAASQLSEEQLFRWTWAAVVLRVKLFEVARNKSPKEVQ